MKWWASVINDETIESQIEASRIYQNMLDEWQIESE
jgi:hypothetical protein